MQKQPHDGKCGAKTRAGTPCQLPAGWGTDHPGTGRCKLHGGASHGAPKGNKNARKHGIYETIIRDKLTDEEKQVFDAVSGKHDLTEELKILRFKLVRLLEPVEKEMYVETKDGVRHVAIEIDEVTKAYAIEKLIDGIRKIIKDMKDTGQDTGSLDKLVEVIESTRKQMSDA